MRPRESCSESRGTSNLIEPRANRPQRMITTTVKPRANTTCLLMSAPSPSTHGLGRPSGRSMFLSSIGIGVMTTDAVNSTLLSIVTEQGIRQQFIAIMADRRMPALILLAGGHGALGLQGPCL